MIDVKRAVSESRRVTYEFYRDSRAVGVVPNTGERIGCQHSS